MTSYVHMQEVRIRSNGRRGRIVGRGPGWVQVRVLLSHPERAVVFLLKLTDVEPA